ncbi:MAG: hypothetical protein ACREHC_05340 [Candidatus Levyibacteriota bacterium]
MSNSECRPPISAIRGALRETAADRMGQWRESFSDGSSLPRSTSVANHLDVTPFSKGERCRLERYAEPTELTWGFSYVIKGDGELAQFREFRQLKPELEENPYRTFRRRIQDTFGRCWREFEQDFESHHPGKLAEMRDRYEQLLDDDPTSECTGVRVNYEHFSTGAELGPETAYFAFAVGLAIDNSRTEVPSLEAATETKEQRLNLALSLSPMLRARSIANVTSTFFTKRRANFFADWESLRLRETPNNTYIFNQRGGQFAAYDQETDGPLIDPTIGCMALLFKIKDTDTCWALDNAISAAIREAGALDLFNPDIARAAAEQRRRIFARPEIAAVADRLTQALPHPRNDPGLKKLVLTFDAEFI